jgi:hypothetical protein
LRIVGRFLHVWFNLNYGVGEKEARRKREREREIAKPVYTSHRMPKIEREEVPTTHS